MLPPVDSLDANYMKHDVAYGSNPSSKQEIKADVKLIENNLKLHLNTNNWVEKPENVLLAQTHRALSTALFTVALPYKMTEMALDSGSKIGKDLFFSLSDKIPYTSGLNETIGGSDLPKFDLSKFLIKSDPWQYQFPSSMQPGK